MWGRLNNTKIKLKYVVGLAVATVLGGAMTATVLASIPDSGGVIHGCYRSNGSLSIIDSATQTCTGNETALNWNQTGPQGPAGPQGPQGPAGPAGANADPIAYGNIQAPANWHNPGPLTVLRSKNVLASTYNADLLNGTDLIGTYFCLKVAFTPHFGLMPQIGSSVNSLVRGENAPSDQTLNAKCGSDYNFAFTNTGEDSNFYDFVIY
jgi:hypothetical protein